MGGGNCLDPVVMTHTGSKLRDTPTKWPQT